jgi:hypothetical protein
VRDVYDVGTPLPGDLNWQLNWQPLHREETELFDGLTVRHMPGHTPGLLTMQVETQNSGHFMLNSDLYPCAGRIRAGPDAGLAGPRVTRLVPLKPVDEATPAALQRHDGLRPRRDGAGRTHQAGEDLRLTRLDLPDIAGKAPPRH